jgi:hypothetical protein
MGVCPLCNGFISSVYTCPHCAGKVEDRGKAVDYIDDYSAYMDENILQENMATSSCTHLFYCTSCENQYQIQVQEI